MAAAARAEAEAIARRGGRRERARSASHGADVLAGARAAADPLQHRRAWPRAAAARRWRVVHALRATAAACRVLACETRPLLQGARLTVWELARARASPHELSSTAPRAGLLRRGEADAVVVGCDRVAANGDVANKVGTYALALAAARGGHPVRGGRPDVDDRPGARPTATAIEIEERDADEVRDAGGVAR